jgi:chromosome segregation ATPase
VFLETQNRSLITQLESSDKRTADATAAAAELRTSLAKREDAEDEAKVELLEAEARIADAESRVSQLLEETTKVVETGEQKRDQLLAEKLTLEEEMAKLKTKVLTVEATVMADWDSDRVDQSHLRERLNDIASEVSRIVYALEGNGPTDSEESLFDRVQRFADDGMKLDEFPVQSALKAKQSANAPSPDGSVSDRMAALRDIQGRS